MNEFILKFKQEWQVQPEFLIHLMGDILMIGGIILFSFLLFHFLTRILRKINLSYLPAPFVDFLQSILKWLVLVVTLFLVLQQVGIKLSSLWAVISTIMAMVAIGFVAVWSVLSNLLCTLMLIFFQPFRVGDHIEIIDPAMTQGMGGRVRNINMIFTNLESSVDARNQSVSLYIPNNLFFQKILRKKKGNITYAIENQIFEKDSLLESKKAETEKKEAPM